MHPWITQHLLFPLYHSARKTGLVSKINQFRNGQWKSRDDLDTYQKTKLVNLLIHAHAYSPYYRDRFDEVGIRALDLSDPRCLELIPLLTKNEINEERARLVSSNHRPLIEESTSGSTGEALYFHRDLESWSCLRASAIVNEEWLGVRIGEKRVSLWGAPMDIKPSRALRGRIHDMLNNSLLLSSYELSESAIARYIQRINAFKPVLLVSYPGPLTTFSEYLLKSGQELSSIKTIICSAETLYPWQKETIERAFSCKVFNRYGSREFGAVAQECTERKGLHINNHRVFLEIVDDDLQPVRSGDVGEIVITDLDNYAMPFIRYRTGDRGAYGDSVCSCGRGLPLLETIEGRTLDIVKTPNGNRVGGTFWTILLRGRPGIKAFQVVQESLNEIVINYVGDHEVREIPYSAFLKEIELKVGPDVAVRFNEVGEIPKTASGKTMFVVSKVGEK